MTITRLLLAIFIMIAFCSVINADEIHLKDGRIIKAKIVWKKDNMYWYEKYGATVSLPEERVLKIVQLEESATKFVAAKSGKEKPKKSWGLIKEARSNCYGECEDTKLICQNESEKTSEVCKIDEGQCQIDCEIAIDKRFKFSTSWLSQTDRKEKSYDRNIKRGKKKLAEIQNVSDERWRKHCERNHNRYKNWIKDCRSWEELKAKAIDHQERKIARWERFQSNTGVLDLDQVDLSKFTRKAKIERQKEINRIRLVIAKSDKSAQLHDYLTTLNMVMKKDHDLRLLEEAFQEELGIDLEEKAEDSIAMN